MPVSVAGFCRRTIKYIESKKEIDFVIKKPIKRESFVQLFSEKENSENFSEGNYNGRADKEDRNKNNQKKENEKSGKEDIEDKQTGKKRNH
jgi:hypothetical protein